MKIKILTLVIAASTLAFTLSAQAHDPSEHMKGTKTTDCTAMKNMDHSKMDINDPVMQAMNMQCMQHADGAASGVQEKNTDDSHNSGEKSTEHKH